MTVYIIYFFSTLLGVISDTFQFKTRNLIFLFNFFILFIIVSLRYGIGPDYFHYEQIFLKSKSLFEIDYLYFLQQENNIEYGYLFLQSIIKIFTDDFSIFIILYNFILFFFLLLGIKKFNHKNIQLFVFFTLLHLYYISGHRQAMAMVILYYNLSNLLDRRLLRFSLFSFLAFLFHRSSLIFFPLYFLSITNINRKIWFLIMTTSLLMSYYSITDSLIIFLYENYREYSYIFHRIYFYYFEHHNLDPVNPLNYLKVIILGIVAYVFYNRLDYRISSFIFLYFSLFMIFSKAGGLAFRIADLFLIYSLCYFTLILDYFKNKSIERILFTICITLYCSISFFRIIYVHVAFNINTFLPYKTIFEK